jgi:hypothetical protein
MIACLANLLATAVTSQPLVDTRAIRPQRSPRPHAIEVGTNPIPPTSERTLSRRSSCLPGQGLRDELDLDSCAQEAEHARPLAA